MARIRSIHPGLFTDEAFISVSLGARLLLIGIWTEADDHGMFEWKPVTLKMRLLPCDAVELVALLAELVAVDAVKNIDSNGRSYGLVRNFCIWQRPKAPVYRVSLPPEFRTYLGLNPDGSRPNAKASTIDTPSIPD